MLIRCATGAPRPLGTSRVSSSAVRQAARAQGLRHHALTLQWARGRAGDKEARARRRSLAYGGNGVARSTASSSSCDAGSRRPGRARVTEGQRTRAEALDRVLRPGPERVGPCAPLPRVRRLRFRIRPRRSSTQKEMRVRDALQRLAGIAGLRSRIFVRARSSTTATSSVLRSPRRPRVGTRLPPGRPLGRGARDRALLAHRRARERDPRCRPWLGARRGSRRTRRPTGADISHLVVRQEAWHGPGARPTRDRAQRAVRDRLPRRRLRRFPGAAQSTGRVNNTPAR